MEVYTNRGYAVKNCTNLYPFGMAMTGRGFNLDKYRFGFNGKEKDKETYGEGNEYDFGARIYDPRTGRWLSVDPQFKEYAPISSYVFSLDNPILFTDENGEYVVGADKNPVTYTRTKDGQIQWTSNATADVKRIGNAMLKTRTGETVFKSMQNTNYPISLKMSAKNRQDASGSTKKRVVNGKVTKADIIIYEGTLNDNKNDYNNPRCSPTTAQGFLYKESMLKTNSLEESIGAVASHEGIHAADSKNIKRSIENEMLKRKNDVEVEVVPEQKETEYLLEVNPIKKMESKTMKEIPTTK